MNNDELDDRKLKQLLDAWRPPPLPERVEARILARSRAGWWRALLFHEFRVPAFVAAPAALALIALSVLALQGKTETEPTPTFEAVDFQAADFEPTTNLNPRLIQAAND